MPALREEVEIIGSPKKQQWATDNIPILSADRLVVADQSILTDKHTLLLTTASSPTRRLIMLVVSAFLLLRVYGVIDLDL